MTRPMTAATLLACLALGACQGASAPAMSGTDPGANAPNIQQRASAMTAAQPGSSTGVTEVTPGANEGRSRRPQAARSASQASGDLAATPAQRPADPYQGGRGSN